MEFSFDPYFTFRMHKYRLAIMYGPNGWLRSITVLHLSDFFIQFPFWFQMLLFLWWYNNHFDVNLSFSEHVTCLVLFCIIFFFFGTSLTSIWICESQLRASFPISLKYSTKWASTTNFSTMIPKIVHPKIKSPIKKPHTYVPIAKNLNTENGENVPGSSSVGIGMVLFLIIIFWKSFFVLRHHLFDKCICHYMEYFR